MKCQFVFDVAVDNSTMDEESKKLIDWRPVKRPGAKVIAMEPYFPAGTVYEHADAPFFVNRGMAVPADDECTEACPGLDAAQLAKLQREFAADQEGITDPEDRELFFAGVILGYEQVDGKSAYRAGPNYAKWRAAQDKIKATAAKSPI